MISGVLPISPNYPIIFPNTIQGLENLLAGIALLAIRNRKKCQWQINKETCQDYWLFERS